MRKSRKPAALGIALVLVAALGVGSTIAWLTAETNEVKNTFTVGDINIELTESDSADDADTDANVNSYKMVPGNTIAKDPVVTVEKGSEACWLFVMVEESANLSKYIGYGVISGGSDGWEALDATACPGVYYREVPATSNDVQFNVIQDLNGKVNQVTVKDTVTKEMMEAIDGKDAAGNATSGEVAPTLKFKAFAVQKANISDAQTAWNKIPAEEKEFE